MSYSIFGFRKRVSEFAFGFRNQRTGFGGPIRFSELENRFSSSHLDFVARKWISEFPFNFRSQETDFAVRVRFSQSGKGFRSSRSVFGIRKRISELETIDFHLFD